MKTETPHTNFSNLGIAPRFMEILTAQKFLVPTPIQAQSIPQAIEGRDLMGIAQTGTGKTLAFGVPMIQRLAHNRGKFKGLVILPTRELALQVDETLKRIGSPLGLKTAILIGGESIGKQLSALKRDPHIIIGTPGRLIDHLENSRLNLSKIGILVLDEADRMLDMGFAPQIKKILQKVPRERQTMLFSATMPDEIVSLAQSYMTLPLRVEVAPAGTAVTTVTHELFFLERNQKLSLLKNLLSQYRGSVLVFSRTKHGARKIASTVRSMGHSSAEIHSNRSLNQRLEALDGFKSGKYRVLVATDIAARGIDVTGIELVINYDLPATAEDYVHRIGRTGRAGLTGHAISFATPDQRSEVRAIERLIRKSLNISQLPDLGSASFVNREHAPERNQRSLSQRSQPRRNMRKSSSRRTDIPRVSRPVHAGRGYFLTHSGK
ncbi:MAG TPA: DEAD/DEAH box helicase [Patescibacteria group bacterium]|nr:DEAD/DEAH box helicase [Patescibacteria group bacterium]